MSLLDSTHRRRLSYLFAESEECNLTLVKEFYANWDPSYGERNEVKINGQFLRSQVFKEEESDLWLPRAGPLVSKIMDVTKVKEPSYSTAPSLSIANHQAHDESWQGRIFGMLELQRKIRG
ncbi:hypothetical protein HAX54_039252 [Datura stramonium]|uniref:Uncharacterized protein n=1 Tax=Datura stramonium TaxID=4076 RepID=A0ABS8VQ90_DATST|nr:hypothetical protein [Datura stramonium]